VVVAGNRKYERLSRRYRVFFPSAILLILVAIGLWVLLGQRPGSLSRETVAVFGDPVIVWSWDTSQNTFTRIEIPANTYITAVEGYGTYSLASLWRLGQIEGKGGEIFTQSLEQALGIPIRQYIGWEEERIAASNSSANLLSLQFVWEYLHGRFRTNIPFRRFVRYSWSFTLGRGRNVFDINLGNRAVASDRLPDGTPIRAIDTVRWDLLIGDTFEDETIRKEAVPVAVYNTTTIPALGERVARLLDHIGILVVAVGNEEGIPERCIVSGLKEHLTSETARRIAGLYRCDLRESLVRDRGDIVVRLGKGLE